jgi:predicted phage terminase large subunit-like protein
MQRLHQDDLAGRLLAKQGWTHLKLPAIAPFDQIIPLGKGAVKVWRCGEPMDAERGSLEVLTNRQREMGSAKFSAQYLQEPVPKDGNFIQRQWFRWYKDKPVKQLGDVIVQSWDTAMALDDHNDYSVCTTWLKRKDDYYLLDVFRDRLNLRDLQRKVRRHAREFDANVLLIEKSGFGVALLQAFANDPPVGRVTAIWPRGNKKDRLTIPAAKIEAGHVFLPTDAPWLPDFEAELLAFPNVIHDDQIDSVSQFLNWASSFRANPPSEGGFGFPVYGD